MKATPAMLAALEPGELLVRLTRDGWTIPPDQVAIAEANEALRDFALEPGRYRGRTPSDAEMACLEGDA